MLLDDTIRTDVKARAEVLMALVEANQVPGFQHLPPLDSVAALERMVGEVAAMGDVSVFVFRVPREVSSGGVLSGATSALILRSLPPNIEGRVMLSFDGYDDDPRELLEIPEITQFCEGLLLGPHPRTPDITHTQHVLAMMLDEFEVLDSGFEHALELAGRLWLVSMAFARECYAPSKKSPSGWLRDMGRTTDICARIYATR